MSDDEQSELERLRAENARLKSAQTRGVSLKVSEKGGLSVYGLGRFPVTLYKEQWTKLLDMADDIRAFLRDNDAVLKCEGRRQMIEWSEQHLMIRDMVRRFVEAEIKPQPRGARARRHAALRRAAEDDADLRHRRDGAPALRRSRSQREKAGEAATRQRATRERATASDIGMQLIPIIELCRYCPGMVTALGVSVGLTAAAIMSKGTIGAEGALGAAAADAREDRRLGDHRARLGLGRVRRHEVDARAATATATC